MVFEYCERTVLNELEASPRGYVLCMSNGIPVIQIAVLRMENVEVCNSTGMPN